MKYKLCKYQNYYYKLSLCIIIFIRDSAYIFKYIVTDIYELLKITKIKCTSD